MDGPTIVAALFVSVAGVTSISAPIIAGRNQRRSDAARFQHDRAMTDTNELRGLIEEIAVALPAAIQRSDTRTPAVRFGGAGRMDPAGLEPATYRL